MQGFVAKGHPPNSRQMRSCSISASKDARRLPPHVGRGTTRRTLLSQQTIAFGQYSMEEAITTNSKGRASPEKP